MAKSTKNEMVKFDPESVKELDAIALRAKESFALAEGFEKALTTAQIISELKNALAKPGILDNIKSLQGTTLGFRTDRENVTDGNKPKEYSIEELVEPIIEATFLQLPYVGNHFNIISNRCYVTKEGFTKKLKDLEGLCDLVIKLAPPVGKSGGAIVNAEMSWSYNGKKESQSLPFAVRMNAGMGADAVLGKAERKAKAWLFRRLTGSNIGDGEVDDLGTTAETGPVTSSFEKPAIETAVETPAEEDATDKSGPTEVDAEYCKIIESLHPNDVARYLKNLGWIEKDEDVLTIPIAKKRLVVKDAEKFKSSVNNCESGKE